MRLETPLIIAVTLLMMLVSCKVVTCGYRALIARLHDAKYSMMLGFWCSAAESFLFGTVASVMGGVQGWETNITAAATLKAGTGTHRKQPQGDPGHHPALTWL